MAETDEDALIASMCDEYGARMDVEDFHHWFERRCPVTGCFVIANEALRLLTLFVIETERRGESALLSRDDHRLLTILEAVEAQAYDNAISDCARYLGVTKSTFMFGIIDELPPVKGVVLPECDDPTV